MAGVWRHALERQRLTRRAVSLARDRTAVSPQLRPLRAPCALPRARSVRACASATQSVDVHQGKLLLEREAHVVLDVRSRTDFDREHLVKPPKSCFSAPYAGAEAAFPAAAEMALGRGKSRGVLIMSADGGADAAAAAAALAAAGYTAALIVEGGYGALPAPGAAAPGHD
jgi:rhodanese-related sulfurtransferase